jgi:phospholipid/cholesterol/gamma-HCH transport system substrate-binding protein
MEASRGQEFKVGLLMIIGIVAITVIVLWSDSMMFANFYRVSAFLDNAGGLRAGSPVTLAGLRIGQVVQVRPNADSRGAIRAELSINSLYTLHESSDLTLLTNGIFGDSFLEFSRPDDPPGPALDTDGTAWLHVQQGALDTMLQQSQEIATGMTDLMSEHNRTQVRLILERGATVMANAESVSQRANTTVNKLERTLDEAQQLLAELRTSEQSITDSFVASAESVQTTLDTWRERVDRVIANMDTLIGDSRQAVQSVDQASTAVGGMVSDNREAVTALTGSLQQLSEHSQALLEGLRQGRGLMGQVLTNDELAGDLNDTVITARELSERLADNPEILVWGQTEEKAEAARKQRERLRARRAFHEGYRRRGLSAEAAPASGVLGAEPREESAPTER